MDAYPAPVTFTPDELSARMTERITRNRKGVLHVNGTPIRVPKTADYTDTEVLQYVQK